MKMPFLICIKSVMIAVSLVASSGCVALQEQREAMQEQREDALIVQDDLRRLRGRIDALESEVERLSQQIAQAGNEQNRVTQSQLEELRRRMSTIEASRETDRREIVSAVSKEVSNLLNKRPARSSSEPARSTKAVEKGYEHVVQPGETLSAIAKAYGVRSTDVMEANGLESADKLSVGQKLFIPAP